MTHRVYVTTFLAVLALAALAPAQTFETLYNFTGGSDAGYSAAGVIRDATGNLYGTAYGNGFYDNCTPVCGSVYEVNSAGTVTVLHSFSGASDGGNPAAPLVRDKAGNIYGTTQYGGATDFYGTAFKIDTAGNETVLYSFTGNSDGCFPMQGLVMDKSGNLYGTTSSCSDYSRGTIFKLDSAGNFTLLHIFTGGLSDGATPVLGRLMMKSGRLYGVTTAGGSTSGCNLGCGVLYQVSKRGTFTVLHKFTGGTKDGCSPYGHVMQDASGNLYGTAAQCGSDNDGIIWKVDQTGKETVLHHFAGGTSDGCTPSAGVTRDSKGNLYGVTNYCGAHNYGALYKLSANGKLTLLHSFSGSDGAYPEGEVLRTSKGTLFSTANFAGSRGYGTVWSYVP